MKSTKTRSHTIASTGVKGTRTINHTVLPYIYFNEIQKQNTQYSNEITMIYQLTMFYNKDFIHLLLSQIPMLQRLILVFSTHIDVIFTLFYFFQHNHSPSFLHTRIFTFFLLLFPITDHSLSFTYSDFLFSIFDFLII